MLIEEPFETLKKKLKATGTTIVSEQQVNNCFTLMESIRINNIVGDFLEAGVYKGGIPIFMNSFLKHHNLKDRKVYAADSFNGFPISDYEKDNEDANKFFQEVPGINEWKFDLSKVQDNFKKFNVLNEQIIFLEGFFSNTLPTAPIEHLSILRFDGDLYRSCLDVLEPLYPKLSKGGYFICDDYFDDKWHTKQAVDEYRTKYKITDPIIRIDSNGMFWKKTNH